MRESVAVLDDDREARLEIRVRVARNVRLARKLAGMSQTDLLDAMDDRDASNPHHRQQLSAWENARRMPSHPWLLRVAAATNQKLGWFFDDHSTDDAAA